jgi:hypothetical protein
MGAKSHNFMARLVNEGLIDHNTVSIYMNGAQGNSSTIKFGGWDS